LYLFDFGSFWFFSSFGLELQNYRQTLKILLIGSPWQIIQDLNNLQSIIRLTRTNNQAQQTDAVHQTTYGSTRMTRCYGGRGQGNRCGRRDGCGGPGRQGRGSGYSSKPKTAKMGLCKELEGHIFDYGGHGAADTMRVTQEKVQQYAGIKFGEDIANEIKNKKLVVLIPPKYSNAIKLRHQEYERLVKRKQGNLMRALKVKLTTLQAHTVVGDDVALDIANVENQIDDLKFESCQEVPNKLTMEEAGGYSNSAKTHSLREAMLEKHCGQVYALIYGQCTQLLQDKMKQEKLWVVVSNSYKPLQLYKLIESVVLKQTKDQYLVAAV
jgi:hypothetical protein